ncbi:MAG: bifunctional tRNA (5-methylaminomethyl-2-thiouridine)(34)-methyltransferase MnmD/FAD-dependent 5-carboxymethylaminomethyl-2-thiouridine(34) oxidoreductase MnmC [Pseudomonadota bacterium]|nr:bifunctional tRNA (5-methylaminomethyl-2-thiouridine)(34)-methyltransferase MnmD/FAD-dependent 5-carboxymethylaminomethyl-2-thiouridine(34) oxidoreductase MnmC [Pseudomonadota bacterium]
MTPAALIWRDGVPESQAFGDVYFSRDNGLDETRYVFIGHNRLTERFSEVSPTGHFVVAETGFGTGLNFLATWAAWADSRPRGDKATLHFVSVEKYPLTRPDLERALALWPQLAPWAEELVQAYPPLIQGTHRMVLAGGSVRLTLYFGDIIDAWRDLEFTADAWFLDGFAPSRNPDMWLERALFAVRAHSRPGTTFATFTAVGRIRRALAEVGFEVQKVPGFGRKRDMLAGYLPGARTESHDATRTAEPIVIIGAGIAGATLARNLAERGRAVILIDQQGPGAGASGNAQGALYVKLGIDYNAQTELAATAFSFAQRYYAPWHLHFWHPTGLLQLAGNVNESDRQARFNERNQYPRDLVYPVSTVTAAANTGVDLPSGGLWFPGAGWLEPARACQVLCDHSGIRRVFDQRVTHIEQRDGHWRLTLTSGEEQSAAALVMAAGPASASLLPSGDQLRLKAIRGQVTRISESEYHLPHAVICGNRYLNPIHQGWAITGATFDLHDENPEPTDASDRENLRELEAMLPALKKRPEQSSASMESRVAFRCTTHDYLPAAGPLPAADGSPQAGLFLFTGLGSKGLSWAPLLAEYLGDLITGQPACLPEPLAKRVDPARLYRKR